MGRSSASSSEGITTPRRAWTLVILAILIAASLHFARCYVVLTGHWISLSAFASGTERMPYQGRMLMMWPMQWANHNATVVQFAAHHVASGRTPDLLVIMAASALSLMGTGFVVTRLYRQVSTLRLFWWAPYALLLLIAFVQYILHSDHNFLYPYDLPSLFFFTTGIFFIYNRKFVPLLLLFPIAVLNRETTVLLVPLLLIDACCEDGQMQWKNLIQVRLLMKAATLLVVWAAILFYVHHRFQANPTELGTHLAFNIKEIVRPEHWPQLLSIGGFLMVPVWYFMRDLEDFRLRMYLWIFPLWFALMLVYGSLLETRVFGELGGLLALASALIFEQRIWRFIKQYLFVPEAGDDRITLSQSRQEL